MGDLLDRLEAESIFILREAVAEAARPVMLYSLGKDSAVMLHLARKAFLTLPFPLLHVDTTWKFKAMYEARDNLAAEPDVDLIVHKNADAEREGINPFDHGARHTELWKTEGLRQALAKHGFDVAFGGARRDEEKSRAKERIVSVRDAAGNWNPRRQRPEPWNLFNFCAPHGETFRVFPLSHWTEKDIWSYIKRENIEISPLYFAANRAVIERGGQLIMVDDDRLPDGGKAQTRKVRFRTLGCYPLTGAIESDADTLEKILAELHATDRDERAGRLIDREGGDHALEAKKREGYF
ncbi:sulfate adenylyltransferase subunit CysD [Sphingomicrobium marinum]|uniref:sulfate adenylyltransferase subunit CysD n=1 Tax=Sphingomicrobium marinum TaxID=1227950 RepID=UPI00223F60A2|nr:sulfate adenylyltransferase subunit CysD [Sphingomicrobium marinum]